MVEDIFLNALDGTAVLNKIRNSSLSVSFHLFPIYKHKVQFISNCFAFERYFPCISVVSLNVKLFTILSAGVCLESVFFGYFRALSSLVRLQTSPDIMTDTDVRLFVSLPFCFCKIFVCFVILFSRNTFCKVVFFSLRLD